MCRCGKNHKGYLDSLGCGPKQHRWRALHCTLTNLCFLLPPAHMPQQRFLSSSLLLHSCGLKQHPGLPFFCHFHVRNLQVYLQVNMEEDAAAALGPEDEVEFTVVANRRTGGFRAETVELLCKSEDRRELGQVGWPDSSVSCLNACKENI